jgi:uncharacterized membrane protein YheB (UPF0754 family)
LNTIWLTPFISAFIGWFTTWLAFKMLFYPKKPINILGLKVQGIFPKGRGQFAEKMGALISKELISFDDIRAKINNPALLEKAMPHIEERMDNFLKTKLNEHLPLVSMFIGKDTLANIKQGISTEIKNSLPALIDKLSNEMEAELDIAKIVTDKVNAFDSDKLENLLNAIMKKEFVYVEIICGVFGFLIGLVQMLFVA